MRIPAYLLAASVLLCAGPAVGGPVSMKIYLVNGTKARVVAINTSHQVQDCSLQASFINDKNSAKAAFAWRFDLAPRMKNARDYWREWDGTRFTRITSSSYKCRPYLPKKPGPAPAPA